MHPAALISSNGFRHAFKLTAGLTHNVDKRRGHQARCSHTYVRVHFHRASTPLSVHDGGLPRSPVHACCRCMDANGRPCLAIVFELANPVYDFSPGTSLASCIERIIEANMRECVFAAPARRPPPRIPIWEVARPASRFEAADRTPETVAQAEPELRWVIAQVRNSATLPTPAAAPCNRQTLHSHYM